MDSQQKEEKQGGGGLRGEGQGREEDMLDSGEAAEEAEPREVAGGPPAWAGEDSGGLQHVCPRFGGLARSRIFVGQRGVVQTEDTTGLGAPSPTRKAA